MTGDSFVRRTANGSYVALFQETGGVYSLLELVIPPGSGPPPHTHLKEDEGFYVLEGIFKVWVGGNAPLELNPGDHAFGPRRIQHNFKNVGTAPGRLLLIFTPGGLEGYFMELAEVRAVGGDDLLNKEEAIDKKYGIVINRR